MQELTKKGLTVWQLEDSECSGAGGGEGNGAGAADAPDWHRFQKLDPVPSVSPRSTRRKVNMCRKFSNNKNIKKLKEKVLKHFSHGTFQYSIIVPLSDL